MTELGCALSACLSPQGRDGIKRLRRSYIRDELRGKPNMDGLNELIDGGGVVWETLMALGYHDARKKADFFIIDDAGAVLKMYRALTVEEAYAVLFLGTEDKDLGLEGSNSQFSSWTKWDTARKYTKMYRAMVTYRDLGPRGDAEKKAREEEIRKKFISLARPACFKHATYILEKYGRQVRGDGPLTAADVTKKSRDTDSGKRPEVGDARKKKRVVEVVVEGTDADRKAMKREVVVEGSDADRKAMKRKPPHRNRDGRGKAHKVEETKTRHVQMDGDGEETEPFREVDEEDETPVVSADKKRPMCYREGEEFMVIDHENDDDAFVHFVEAIPKEKIPKLVEAIPSGMIYVASQTVRTGLLQKSHILIDLARECGSIGVVKRVHECILAYHRHGDEEGYKEEIEDVIKEEEDGNLRNSMKNLWRTMMRELDRDDEMVRKLKIVLKAAREYGCHDVVDALTGALQLYKDGSLDEEACLIEVEIVMKQMKEQNDEISEEFQERNEEIPEDIKKEMKARSILRVLWAKIFSKYVEQRAQCQEARGEGGEERSTAWADESGEMGSAAEASVVDEGGGERPAVDVSIMDKSGEETSATRGLVSKEGGGERPAADVSIMDESGEETAATRGSAMKEGGGEKQGAEEGRGDEDHENQTIDSPSTPVTTVSASSSPLRLASTREVAPATSTTACLPLARGCSTTRPNQHADSQDELRLRESVDTGLTRIRQLLDITYQAAWTKTPSVQAHKPTAEEIGRRFAAFWDELISHEKWDRRYAGNLDSVFGEMIGQKVDKDTGHLIIPLPNVYEFLNILGNELR